MKPNVTNLWPEDHYIISANHFYLRKNRAQHMKTRLLLFALYSISCLSEMLDILRSWFSLQFLSFFVDVREYDIGLIYKLWVLELQQKKLETHK